MENRKRIELISFLAALLALLALPLYLLLHRPSDGAENSKATFVGKETCIECHLNEYNDWTGSHHDKAMDHANDSTVLGDFNDQTLMHDGVTHKMYKRDGRFYVFTDGENGEMEEFEIKYVFGFYPLQQFLVEFDRGRLQTLPLTWNSKDSLWYHMVDAIYTDQDIDHTNWLHWTNQAQNWNSMCADCHSTNLVKGYDVETDSYNTTWSEIDVSCEACHGPASKHLEWAAKADYARDNSGNFGLKVKTGGIDNKAYVDLCERCHSRRVSLTDYNHDSDIYNHSIPNLPVPQAYHIDGQILDEDYVYASFTQSKMYMRDVQCNDCHNVHTTERLYEDNRLCTQCHRADDYDTYNHHFHKSEGEVGEAVIADDGVRFEVGEGTRCINCHMPAQFYMGVDYRNDHSMRVPRPDLTKTLGTPNACNQCHKDETVDWAVSYVNKWYGESRPYQYGVAFSEAERGTEKGFNDLVHIFKDDVYPEIVRATAINYLGMYYPLRSKSILLEALGVSNNHIRYNALNGLLIDDEESLKVVYELLNDPALAIRIVSANKISQLNLESVSEVYREAYEKANSENLETMNYNADFPTGKYNLGNYYYNNGDIDKAAMFFEKAMAQDSLLHSIKINLAIIYNIQKQYDKADVLFKDYLSHVPDDGNALFNYALFLSEQKRYDASLEYLLKASAFSPENARIKYNIAMMYDFKENVPAAEKYLQSAIKIASSDINYHIALLNLYVKHKQMDKAKSLGKEILEKFPNNQYAEQIKQMLE